MRLYVESLQATHTVVDKQDFTPATALLVGLHSALSISKVRA